MKKIVLLIAILLLVLTSCNSENSSQMTTFEEVHHDHDVSVDVEELISKSTHIFVGTAIEVVDTINLSRDFNDPTKPDPQRESIGERILFSPSTTLKGDVIDDEILLVSLKSVELPSPELNGKMKKYDIPYYNEIMIGEEVIVFVYENPELSKIFPNDRRQFEPASSPYIFTLSSDKVLKLIEKDEDVKKQFIDKEFNIEKLLKAIEKNKK
ncbi:MAG: hypothetical protein JEZ08_16670 [Clostridiales bacterium]|nr:hypothetical protein [Clostridiales bacterium]